MSASPELERLLADVAATIARADPSAIVLVARGSSDNAAVYGRYLLEVCDHRLTSLGAPSGLTLYGSGPRLDRTVVIGISQSGQGEDVVAYVREARRQGAPTVAIVNDAASPLVDAGGRSSESALAIAAAIRQRGGEAAMLRAGQLEPLSKAYPSLEVAAPLPEPYAPIAALVLGQLLAIELALASGVDPARPRGLRKVTSTR